MNSKNIKMRLYDRLKIERKGEGFSLWLGLDGSKYLIRKTDGKNGKPAAYLFKDRKYLSGLFSTKNPLEFSADYLDEKNGKKHFLRLVVSAGQIDIFER